MARYKVSPDLSKITLNEPDRVKSILQNISIILSTLQGTVPLYRDFGLNKRSVDKPINVAKPMIIADVTEAINEFEPRARVVSVSFLEDKDSPGKLIPIVEVEIDEES